MTGWFSLRLSQKISISANGLVSSIVVGDDAVYAADRQDEVVAIDRRSLQRRWRVPAERRNPMAQCGNVLITETLRERISALSTKSGELVWNRAVPFGMRLWGSRLVAPRDSSIEIVESTTGLTVEVLQVSDQVASPGVVCGDVFLWYPDLGGDPARAFGLRSAQLLWSRDLQAEMKSKHGAEEPVGSMGLTCGTLPDSFIAVRGAKTFGCSLEDGRIRWCAPFPVPHRIPMVHQGRVYAAWSERFVALDEATGEVIYDVTHPELKSHPKHGTAYRAKTGTVYGDTLAVPHESGHLAIFNLKDGSLAWLYMSKAPLWSSAEADGRLLVGTADGKLLVFEQA